MLDFKVINNIKCVGNETVGYVDVATVLHILGNDTLHEQDVILQCIKELPQSLMIVAENNEYYSMLDDYMYE